MSIFNKNSTTNQECTEKEYNSTPLYMASSCFLASYATNLVATTLFLIIAFIITSPSIFTEYQESELSYTFEQMLIAVMPAMTLAFIIVPLIFTKIQKMSIIKDFKVKWCGIKNIICAVTLGVLLVFLMSCLTYVYLQTLNLFGLYVPDVPEPSANSLPQLIAHLLCFAAFPAIVEELFVRGYLLRNLEKYFKPVTTVILTALLFAFLHGNINSFVATFVAGIYLAVLVYRTNSIIPSIIVHFVNNAISVLVSYFSRGVSEDSALPTLTLIEYFISIIPFLVIVVIIVGFTLLVLHFCKKISSPSDDEINNTPRFSAKPGAWIIFSLCFVFSIVIYLTNYLP